MAVNDRAKMHQENCLALSRLSDKELEQHQGEYAIIVAGEVVNYYSSLMEAVKQAATTVKNAEYSIQCVETQPIDMGFIASADYPR